MERQYNRYTGIVRPSTTKNVFRYFFVALHSCGKIPRSNCGVGPGLFTIRAGSRTGLQIARRGRALAPHWACRDTDHVKHYFRFRNKEGNDEEFIVNYRRFKSELEYLRTHWKRLSVDPEFRTLSERGPWSIAITHLIDKGQRLSANTRPTREHFASKVSTDTLRDRNWVPPAASTPAENPKVSPQPDVKKKRAATALLILCI